MTSNESCSVQCINLLSCIKHSRIPNTCTYIAFKLQNSTVVFQLRRVRITLYNGTLFINNLVDISTLSGGLLSSNQHQLFRVLIQLRILGAFDWRVASCMVPYMKKGPKFRKYMYIFFMFKHVKCCNFSCHSTWFDVTLAAMMVVYIYWARYDKTRHIQPSSVIRPNNQDAEGLAVPKIQVS